MGETLALRYTMHHNDCGKKRGGGRLYFSHVQMNGTLFVSAFSRV